jgi:hypothetical protein
MEARDGPQGNTGPGAETRQLGPADLGRGRPLGRETDQARSDTKKKAEPRRSPPESDAAYGSGGIREKLSVNAVAQEAFWVALPMSGKRSGFIPRSQLAYDSGSRNGLFAFGWSFGVPVITR